MKFVCIGHEAISAMIEQRLEDAGHVAVDDASQAGLILTYCTSQTQLEDVYFDEEGIIKKAASNALVIDLSATTPRFARELAALAMVSNLSVVEAPMMVLDPSAADALVERDNVACFVAGDEDAKKLAAPILETLFGGVRDMGDTGAASLARAAYTIQATASMVAAIEADALYRAVRCMPQGMGMAAQGRAGALSPACDALLDAVEEERFGGACTIEMLMGQVAAVLSCAEDAEIALPQTEGLMQLLEMLALIGGAGKQPAALALAYRDPDEVKKHGLDWSNLQSFEGHDHDGLHFQDEVGGFDFDEDDDYDEEEESPFMSQQDEYLYKETHVDYGFDDDDPGYDFASERVEEYADFEDDDFID